MYVCALVIVGIKLQSVRVQGVGVVLWKQVRNKSNYIIINRWKIRANKCLLLQLLLVVVLCWFDGIIGKTGCARSPKVEISEVSTLLASQRNHHRVANGLRLLITKSSQRARSSSYAYKVSVFILNINNNSA